MSSSRIKLSLLGVSATAVLAWVSSEDIKLAAYTPTVGDVPTIGAGATEYEDGKKVKLGEKITPKRAVTLLLHDVDKFSRGVKKCLPDVAMYQHEFDSSVHLAKNIGINAFCSSQTAKAFREGRYEDACNKMLLFKRYKKQDCSVSNKVCGGLWTDRQETVKWCLGKASRYWTPDESQ